MPYDVYDFIIKAVRDSDEDRVLEKFVEGFQTIYEAQWDSLDSLRKLYSPNSPLTSDKLDYLLKTLGMPTTLSAQLQEYQKRRLIWQLVMLWKIKSVKKGIAAHFNAIGDINTSYDEQFDFRWILEENALTEDNFILSQADLSTTDLYMWVPYWQELSLLVHRSAASAGPLRVKVVDLSASPTTIATGSPTLHLDMQIAGDSASVGVDILLSSTGWLGDLAAASAVVDQFDYPINLSLNSPGSSGEWIRRSFDLTDYIGEDIEAIALYDNTDAIGVSEVKVRRVVLIHSADNKCTPLFCYKSHWTNAVVGTPAATITHSVSSGLSFQSSAELIRSIAMQMRPVGERFHMHFMFERHHAPFTGYKGLVLSSRMTVEAVTGHLVFPPQFTPFAITLTGDGGPGYPYYVLYRIIAYDANHVELGYGTSQAVINANYWTWNIQLSWAAVTGAAYYKVCRDPGSFVDNLPNLPGYVTSITGTSWTENWADGDGIDYRGIGERGWIAPVDTDKYLGAKDYSVSAQIDGNEYCGVYLNLMNASAYKMLITNGTAYIYRMVNASLTLIGTNTYDARGTRHRVVFMREGNTFKISVDGSLVMTVTDANAQDFSGPWQLFGTDIELVELGVMPIPTHREELGR